MDDHRTTRSSSSFEDKNHPIRLFAHSKIKEIVYDESFQLDTNEETHLSDEEKRICILKADSYLSQEELEWNKNKNRKGTVPPIYDRIYHLAKLIPCEKILKSTIQEICQIPRDNDTNFKNWLTKEQETRLLHGNEPTDRWIHTKDLRKPSLVYTIIVIVFLLLIISASIAKFFIPQNEFSLEMIKKMYQDSWTIFGILLLFEILLNGFLYLMKERGWKRAIAIILCDFSSFVLATGVIFAIASVLSSWIGPRVAFFLGTLFGIGTIYFISDSAITSLTAMLGIPRDELLEKAFGLLELTKQEVNSVISKKYLEMSYDFHPDEFYRNNMGADDEDKNDNLKEFLKIQAAFNVIKAAREEDVDGYRNGKSVLAKVIAQKKMDEVNVTNYGKCLKIVGKKLPIIPNAGLPLEFFKKSEVLKKTRAEPVVEVVNAVPLAV